MTELADKNALIVGADEIGLGIAERLKRARANVSRTDLDALPHTLECDVLVLNPLGPPRMGPLEGHDDIAFGEALASVALAASFMRSALPHMRTRGGRIILVGHHYGESVSEGIGPYNAAAFALVGLARTAAVEWGQYGITTNVLIPFADTAELRAAREQRPKIIDLFVGQTALGRAGDPIDDIGGAALFLASDDAAFVNGQIIYADGGQHIAAPVLSPAKFAG